MERITELKLAPDLMEHVYDGTKRITIRTGHRNIIAGQKLIIENAEEASDWTEVYPHTIVHTSLKHVNEDYLGADGFLDPHDAAEKMKRFYPTISVDSPVTVIIW